MPGFRSLDDDEEIQFTVRLGRRGLEAENVTGIRGKKIRGHSIRPLATKHGEKDIFRYLFSLIRIHFKNTFPVPRRLTTHIGELFWEN